MPPRGRLSLGRQSDLAVYQLGVNSQGHVTYVRLLGYANECKPERIPLLILSPLAPR